MTTEQIDSAPFVLRLFGPFDATIHGEPLPKLRTRKGQWLIALLALAGGRELDRDWLAYTLWPDSEEKQARTSLRQSLANLRDAMGSEAWRIIAGTTRIKIDLVGADVDLMEFDLAVKQGDTFSKEYAVSLYRGPLLQGCIEEWVLNDRQAREQKYLDVLETLASSHISDGQISQAISELKKLVVAEPERESAQRSLMSALALAGDLASVTMVYRDLRVYLRNEHNVDPSPETVAVYERIRGEARDRLSIPAKARQESVNSPGPSETVVKLPKPLTSLIGRDSIICNVLEILISSHLVTICGPGGVGKTRIAVEVGRRVAAEHDLEVYFADLSAVDGPGQLIGALGALLNVQDRSDASVYDELLIALKHKPILLVLDNCEHIIDEVATLAIKFLTLCPNLKLLATSRQPLAISGESVWTVCPLEVPPILDGKSHTRKSNSDDMSVGSLSSLSDAEQLFLERAKAANPGFQLNEANFADVAEICRYVDGIPLAIELAAARTRVLDVHQIRARLSEIFSLLSSGARGGPARQQTLKQTIDWSYRLLTSGEQTLLKRLAVFSSGWTLEAAEQICAEEVSISDETAILLHEDVLPLLSGLVEKNLVMVQDESTGRRYRLLYTILAYAKEIAEKSGGLEECRIRHLHYFAGVAEYATTHFRSAEQTRIIWSLERERDELRNAMDFANSRPDMVGEHLRLVGGLWRFWMVRGYFTDGIERVKQALMRPFDESLESLRAPLLAGMGGLLWSKGDHEGMELYLGQALEAARHLDDKPLIGQALNSFGILHFSRGNYELAVQFYQDSLDLRRQVGNLELVSVTVGNLGVAYMNIGDMEQAKSALEEATMIARQGGDKIGLKSCLMNLSAVARHLNDLDTFKSRNCEALELSREVGDLVGVGGTLHNLAYNAIKRRNYVEAKEFAFQSLDMRMQTGFLVGLADTLETVAEILFIEGNHKLAVQIWAATETVRKQQKLARMPYDESDFERCLAVARDTITEQEYTSAWATGTAFEFFQIAKMVQKFRSNIES